MQFELEAVESFLTRQTYIASTNPLRYRVDPRAGHLVLAAGNSTSTESAAGSVSLLGSGVGFSMHGAPSVCVSSYRSLCQKQQKARQLSPSLPVASCVV